MAVRQSRMHIDCRELINYDGKLSASDRQRYANWKANVSEEKIESRADILKDANLILGSLN